MSTLTDAMLLSNKPIHECYQLYLDACKKLKHYRVFYKEGFKPDYPDCDYNCYCYEISYEEFIRYVNIVNAVLICFPHLKEEYKHSF